MASGETTHLHPPQEGDEKCPPALSLPPLTKQQQLNFQTQTQHLLDMASKSKHLAKQPQNVDINQSPVKSKPSYLHVAQGCSRSHGDPAVQVSRSFDASSSSALHSALDVDSLPLKPISLYQGIPSVLFSLSEKQVLVDKLKFVLVGKFSHGMPPLNLIKKFFAAIKLQMSCSVSLFDKKHIFIECFCKVDYDFIWLHLSWVINGFTMRVLKWSADFNPIKESAIVPVWVRLEGLPLYMFDEISLLAIAHSIGKPIKVDSRNVARTIVNSARICVELDVSKPLLSAFWVSFEDEVTKVVKEGFKVKVVYDVLPNYCGFCSHLGHGFANCKRREEKDLQGNVDLQNLQGNVVQSNSFVHHDSQQQYSLRSKLQENYTGHTSKESAADGDENNHGHIIKNLDVDAYVEENIQGIGVVGGQVKGLQQLENMLARKNLNAGQIMLQMEEQPHIASAVYTTSVSTDANCVEGAVVQELHEEDKQVLCRQFASDSCDAAVSVTVAGAVTVTGNAAIPVAGAVNDAETAGGRPVAGEDGVGRGCAVQTSPAAARNAEQGASAVGFCARKPAAGDSATGAVAAAEMETETGGTDARKPGAGVTDTGAVAAAELEAETGGTAADSSHSNYDVLSDARAGDTDSGNVREAAIAASKLDTLSGESGIEEITGESSPQPVLKTGCSRQQSVQLENSKVAVKNLAAGIPWADLVEEEKEPVEEAATMAQTKGSSLSRTERNQAGGTGQTGADLYMEQPGTGTNSEERQLPKLDWSAIEGYAMDEIEMIMASPTRIGPVFARTVPKFKNASIHDLEGTPVLCTEVIRNSARIADVRKHFHFLSNEKLVATLVEQGKYEELIKDAMKTYTKEIHQTLLAQEKSIYPKDSTTEKVPSMTQEATPKVSTMDEKEWTTPKRRGRNRNRSK